jgi:hypothetical protein
MIDQKTVNREYPVPHPDNMLEEDVNRIKDSFEKIDVDVNDLYASTSQQEQDAQSGAYWFGDSTGNGAAYEVNLTPPATALNEGMFVYVKAHVANTGPATINVNSLGQKNIKKIDGSDLKSGDIPVDGLVTLVYDGTNFQLANSVVDNEQTAVNTSNIMRAFEEIQENHGGALLMEAGWSDSFENSNEQGADESNSIEFQYDNSDKFYKATDPGTNLLSSKTYTTESAYLQQEWTNANQTTSQATVTLISSVDQSSLIGGTDTTVGNGVPQNTVGQSFLCGLTGILDKFIFRLKKVGSPTDDLIGYLYSVSPQSPTGAGNTLLATTDTVSGSAIGSSYEEVTFQFSGSERYTINSGTYYCVIISRSGSVDGSHYWIQDSITPSVYTEGNAVAPVGTANNVHDRWFKIFVESNRSISLSSGSFPTNCAGGRISFDSGSTWQDISSRDSDTQLTLASGATNGTSDYSIRMSKHEITIPIAVNSKGYGVNGGLAGISQTSNNTLVNMDNHTEIINDGRYITHLGARVGSAGIISMKIFKEDSTAQFDVLYTEDFTISANGSVNALYDYFKLSTPFKTPNDGSTLRVGFYRSSGTTYNSGTGGHYAYKSGNTGVSSDQSFTYSASGGSIFTAYKYEHRATVTGGTNVSISDGHFPENVIDSFITFDGEASWHLIASRVSDTAITLATSATDGDFTYKIKKPAFKYNSVGDTSGSISSNVKLLINFNRGEDLTSATDQSANAHSITFEGNAKLDTSNKKFGTASVLFDGDVTTKLTIPSHSDFDLGSNDFCFEFWYQFGEMKTNGGSHYFFGKSKIDNSVYYDFAWSYESGFIFYENGGLGNVFICEWVPEHIDKFYHIAVTREGNFIRMFVDGFLIATQYRTGSFTNMDDKFVIGRLWNDVHAPIGHLDEFRFTKGDAVYTSNFTPQTSEFPCVMKVPAESHISVVESFAQKTDTASWSNINAYDLDPDTYLLLHFEGANGSALANDSSVYKRHFLRNRNGVTTEISTTQSKFGSSSFYANGASDQSFGRNVRTGGDTYDTHDYHFDEDFTIDCWIWPGATFSTSNMCVYSNAGATNRGFGLMVSNTQMGVWINGTQTNFVYGTPSITEANWHHVAAERQGSTWNLYIDGTRIHQFTDSTAIDYSWSNPRIGRLYSTNGTEWKGHIDELRLSKVARYQGAASFSVPTNPYGDTAVAENENRHGRFQPVDIENHVEPNATQNFGKSTVVGEKEIGQSWTTDKGGILGHIETMLHITVGVPENQMVMDIYATSGDHPTGSVLATSDNVAAKNVDDTTAPFGKNVRFFFHGSNRIRLEPSTKYAFVLRLKSGASDTQYWIANYNTSDTHVGGTMFKDGSPWTSITGDMHFKVRYDSPISYWFAFDPASAWGIGTEVKVWNNRGSVWRKIAKNNAGTWQYNDDSTDTVSETWVNATTNDMLHAVSQAVEVQTANTMFLTDLHEISHAEWEASGGWSTSVNSLARGFTLINLENGLSPSVSKFDIDYDSSRAVMDLRSKTYDPGFVPTEGYIWSRIEHSDSDGSGNFYVSRNGGTEWTSVSMAQQGLALAGDIRIYRGAIDISGQISGQDLRCRYETEEGKDQFLHAWGLQAKS